MALPGFTAEASIGPTTQTYRVLHQYGMAGTEYLSPQGMDDDTELDDSEIDEGQPEDDGMSEGADDDESADAESVE